MVVLSGRFKSTAQWFARGGVAGTPGGIRYLMRITFESPATLRRRVEQRTRFAGIRCGEASSLGGNLRLVVSIAKKYRNRG